MMELCILFAVVPCGWQIWRIGCPGVLPHALIRSAVRKIGSDTPKLHHLSA